MLNSVEKHKIEEAFDLMAVQLFSSYQNYERFIPMFPYCVVRVLPKSMHIGSIYVPDMKYTNKPVYEGIVVRVWEKKTVPSKHSPRGYAEITSSLKLGDHVLFPHFAGQPLEGLDEAKYRAVPEGITRSGAVVFGNDVGCIFASVDFVKPKIEDMFKEVWDKFFGDAKLENIGSEWNREHFFKLMKSEFELFIKTTESKTKSGV